MQPGMGPPEKGVEPDLAPSPPPTSVEPDSLSPPSPPPKGVGPRASSPSPSPTNRVGLGLVSPQEPPLRTKDCSSPSPPLPTMRIGPDLVSSTSPSPTRRVDHDTVGSPSPRPTKRARRQAGHGLVAEEPAPGGEMLPFSCFEMDLWIEVAKHMEGQDLQHLSYTCHGFHLLLSEDSIWRYAFLRDMTLPTNITDLHPPHGSWRVLYMAIFDNTHGYCFHQPDKHIGWFRVGGFVLDTSNVLLTSILPLPQWLPQGHADGVQAAIETMGACLLTDARHGIWVADMNLAQCTICNPDNSCQGTVQILVGRHCELYVDRDYRNGNGQYEDLGQHFVHQEVAAAFSAVFNPKYLHSHYASGVVGTKRWTLSRDNLEPKGYSTPVAVALSSNLPSNQGLSSRFEAMRDLTGDGKIVSVRITQHLL